MTTNKQDDTSSQPGEVRSSEGLGLLTERAAFEAWAMKKWGSDAYRHTSATSGEWDAWQAGAAGWHDKWDQADSEQEATSLGQRLRQCLPTMSDGPDHKTWCSVLGSDLRAMLLACEHDQHLRVLLRRDADRLACERYVLARWMAEALQVLCDVDADAEDGGESLRMLKDRGERLVRAALAPTPASAPSLAGWIDDDVPNRHPKA